MGISKHNRRSWLLNGAIILSAFLLLATVSINPSISQSSPPEISVPTQTQSVISDHNPSVTPSPLFIETLIPSPSSTFSFTPIGKIQATATLPLVFTDTPFPTPTLESTKPVSNAQQLKIHFIDVGQGDSILIESSDGKNILIDGGDSNYQALNYLRSAGIKKIDLMIATHPHADHIGGLVEILNSIPTSKVITNGELYTTQVYEKFLDGIANAKAEYSEVKQGDTISIGNLNFSVLNPLILSKDNVNNNSIVLRLVYGNESFLFMGDAEKEVESRIINLGSPLKSDFIKLGHHGSSSSSSIPFMKTVHPTIAIYTAGLGNSYNHPDPTVIGSLLMQDIKVFGTDKNGTITITTDGVNYMIDTTLSNSPVSLP